MPLFKSSIKGKKKLIYISANDEFDAFEKLKKDQALIMFDELKISDIEYLVRIESHFIN